jgi:hypothetical protein
MHSVDSGPKIEDFQKAVVNIITDLETSWSGTRTWDQQTLGAVGGTDHAIGEVLDQAYRDGTKSSTTEATKEEFRQAALQAESALKNKANRVAFCKVLKSVSVGASDTANVLVPIFLPMAVAGTIAVPVAPLVWALLAVTIARIGVSNLCSD